MYWKNTRAHTGLRRNKFFASAFRETVHARDATQLPDFAGSIRRGRMLRWTTVIPRNGLNLNVHTLFNAAIRQ
jgi:hypothetical protein